MLIVFYAKREGDGMKRLAGKKTIIVLSLVFICFFALYMMVNAAYTPTVSELSYPEGSLSDSIFVGQNNSYLKNDAFTKTHTFSEIPYLVDLPESQGARIGSGTVYQAAEDVFLYFSEYADYENIYDIISSQFPAALLVDYVPEETKISMLYDRFGFINGFSAEYIVEHIRVCNGVREVEAVVMGYVLDVSAEHFEGMKMFVGIGTTAYDNEKGEACATILDAVIASARMDEKLAASILRNRTQEEGLEDILSDGSVTSIPIVIRTHYDVMSLNVSFSRGNADAVLELFLPDGASYCDPVFQDGGGAKFVLDDTKPGTYMLRIRNYKNCGDILTTIESHAREGEAK